MRWTYDLQADACYILLADSHLKLVTVDLCEAGVHLDVDAVTGELVGIEIIGGNSVGLLGILRRFLSQPPEILGEKDA